MSATQANQIWKLLDDMAESNPKGYREFVEKQMEEAKLYFSKPKKFSCFSVKSGNEEVFINVCSWKRVPSHQSPDDSMPVTGGKLFDGNAGKKTAIVALNPDSLGIIEKFRNWDDLIQLIIDVVESQNDVKLTRTAVFTGDDFYGDFADLLEKSFPGISKQSDELSHNLKGTPISSIIERPMNVIKQLAEDEESSLLDSPGQVLIEEPKAAASRPLIEEISSSSTEKRNVGFEKINASELDVKYMDIEGSSSQKMIEITFPVHWGQSFRLSDCFVKKPNQVTIDLSFVGSAKNERLTLNIPFTFKEEGAVAKFSRKTWKLKVTVYS